MIIEPPYVPEWMVYDKVPHDQRWIFNKIELGHRLGYQCDPIGLRMPAGSYCIRPPINIRGMATGGFKKVTLDRPGFINGYHGMCVTPWNDGPRSWHQYVNDEWHNGQREVNKENGIEHYEQTITGPRLPPALCGISRYMLVERLGNMVIDVGPRHMLEEMRDSIVADYRKFNPSYEPAEWCMTGFLPTMRTVERDGWLFHEEIEDQDVEPCRNN